jgi:hypothetical protein
MIANIYQRLKDEQDPEEIKSLLESSGRIEIFERVISSYENWVPVFKFILFSYSIESDHIQNGDNWEQTRKEIANLVGIQLDDRLNFEEIVYLKAEPVWKTVDQYLKFQQSREFRHLMGLRAAYERMISSLFAEMDFDQQAKNTVHAQNIWDKIGEYEQMVRQRYGEAFMKVLKDTTPDIRERKKAKGGLTLEDSPYIGT